jgi:FkbM family methyltransferase
MTDGKPTLRNKVRLFLEKTIGLDNFRFYLSIYNLRRLHKDPVEADFVHFLGMIPTDKLILDVGANFGIMAVSMARKAVNGKVYAFEPIPENARALKRLAKHFKLNNITVFECAVGDHPGELKMILPIVNNTKIHGWSHVVDENNTHEGELFTVPVKRLDDIPELQQAKTIGAIKMDVENFEYEALTGARQLLLKHKPLIFCEIWNNDKGKQTLNFLKNEIGYQIKVLNGGKLVPFTDQDALNYFMIP